MFVTPPQPSLVSLGKGPNGKERHAIRFVMDIEQDSAPSSSPATLGATQVYGDVFNFDSQSLGPASSAIGPIKSIQYMVQFYNGFGSGVAGAPDGDFIIYIAGTGQYITIASGVKEESTDVIQNRCSASGCISVETSNVPSITFAKSMNLNSVCAGEIFVTLFDFEVAPWISPSTINYGIFPV